MGIRTAGRVILLALVAVPCHAQVKSYDLDNFQKRVQAQPNEQGVVRVCRDFLTNASDIDVARAAQDQWTRVDSTGMRAYTRELYTQNPQSPRQVYLLGRIVGNPVEAIELGRQAIALDPVWPYGYRLVLMNYFNELFAGHESPYRDQLELSWLEDEDLLYRWIELEPNDPWALGVRYRFEVYQEDYDAALATFAEARVIDAPWALSLELAGLHILRQDYVSARAAVAEHVDAGIREAGWPAEDRDQLIEESFMNLLIQYKRYEDALAVFDYRGEDTWQLEDHYNRACILALMGRDDEAFDALERAADLGLDDVTHCEADEDLEVLHKDRRWTAFLVHVEDNWNAGAEGRRARALEAAIMKPAPDWTMEDPDGQVVTLQDLRGKIVIMDFWATWCDICTNNMPVLHDFVREHASPEVVVLSVNVFDGSRENSLAWWQGHDFAMRFLFGNQDVTGDYGVQGIPYLCIIDQEGNIRFEEFGIQDGLLDQLIAWTEALLKQG